MFFVLFAVLVIAGEEKETDGKHRRAVYFYSNFFERVKDTLMAGISLIQSDVNLS